MRRILLLCGALLFTGCLPTPAAPTPHQRPLDASLAHTILLQDPGCTGIRVGGGLVLTAKHCMNDRKVGDPDSGFVVGFISPLHDFAVLTGDTEISPVAMVDAIIGEHVYVIGYPESIDDGQQYRTVTDGVYTGVTYNDMQRVTAFGYYGNSGGGVWNDKGELLGVLVQMRPTDATYHDKYPTPFPAYTYMVKIKYVRKVMVD